MSGYFTFFSLALLPEHKKIKGHKITEILLLESH